MRRNMRCKTRRRGDNPAFLPLLRTFSLHPLFSFSKFATFFALFSREVADAVEEHASDAGKEEPLRRSRSRSRSRSRNRLATILEEEEEVLSVLFCCGRKPPADLPFCLRPFHNPQTKWKKLTYEKALSIVLSIVVSLFGRVERFSV